MNDRKRMTKRYRLVTGRIGKPGGGDFAKGEARGLLETCSTVNDGFDYTETNGQQVSWHECLQK